MDHSLSFKTTMRSRFWCPAWFRPSRARPDVSDPSPITAMTLWSSSFRSLATARPSAAEMEVPECPVPKTSHGLSEMRGNPEIPPWVRRVGKASLLPVRILWVYAW
jgi:hypothetical protein